MKNLQSGCLDAITVLDFTRVLASTHATKMLADTGAKVNKVEPYPIGAIERYLPKLVTQNGVRQSSYSINVNRGKKDSCIDKKTQRHGPYSCADQKKRYYG